jgi:tetratricopeptide (TPR) repeat protein
MLAHHYYRGENCEKAFQYLRLSGEKAMRSYSNWEGFRFYRETINALKRLPETDENKRREIEVGLAMYLPMLALAWPEDSLEILQEGARLATELGDERSLARFYSSIGLHYSFKGDPIQGTKYAENAFEAAEKAEDIELMAPIGFDLCFSYIISGELYKVAEIAPKVIALLERTQREYESFSMAWNMYSTLLGFYGVAMAALGEIGKGKALCEKAIRFAREINDLYAIAVGEINYGQIFLVKQDGENAIAHAENADRIFRELGAVAISSSALYLVGLAHYYLGELATAREHAEEAIKIGSNAGMPFGSSHAYLLLGMVNLDSGDLENAQSCTEEALKLAQNNNDRFCEGNVRIWTGRILGKAGPSQGAKAEEYILQGIKILEELRIKPWCSEGYLHLGELYADTGQREKALEYLKKAEGMFREMGMDYGLRQTQSVLERLQG